MEKHCQKKCGSFGNKSLTFFMKSGDFQPTPLATKTFFKINMAVINTVYPEVEEREAIREELKNHFITLLYYPIGDSFYSCFNNCTDKNSKCQFYSLIKTDWRKKDDETCFEYNKRYRQVLAEIFPDFENKFNRMTNDRSEEYTSFV
uniref:PIR Superfamily Protein n=1 Tax=Strongyloides venezuelensis TaxID=75913 RepID=A0A0K0FTX9_STRVS